MTRVHLLLIALVVLAAAVVGELTADQIVFGTLDDSIIWGN